MARVLVTGATGFVGSAACAALSSAGWAVRAAVRQERRREIGDVVSVGDIGPTTQWGRALENVDAVLHLAARAHVMRDRSSDPLREFRGVNTRGTECLARAAAAAGVRRLVFVSTVKVNGERTEGRPFTESDPPMPEDPYGISKWEAERSLWEISGGTRLEVAVVRPPLVYGPGAKGNLARLLRLIDRNIPLPFANCTNRRSLVSVGNLVSFLVRALDHPNAAGETFLISDGEDLTTAEIVSSLAAGMGRHCRLFPCPQGLIRGALRASGRGDLWQRLWGSLQVDSAKARTRLGWEPPEAAREALAEVGAAYRRAQDW